MSYLRQGGRGKKNKRRDKDRPLFKMPEEKHADDSIYGEIGDYRASRSQGDYGHSSKSMDSKYYDKTSGKNKYFGEDNEQHDKEIGMINSKLNFLANSYPKICNFLF